MRRATPILILLALLQSNSGIAQKDSLRLIEYYADSTHIGRPNHNKVELFVYENPDTSFVILNFYSRGHGHWSIRQHLSFPRLDLASPDPHYSDFNNDGLGILPTSRNSAPEVPTKYGSFLFTTSRVTVFGTS